MVLLQLSDSSWINLDQVTMIRHQATWTVWTTDDPEGFVLSPEEGEVLAHYLYAHAERAAYTQTQRQREEPTSHGCTHTR